MRAFQSATAVTSKARQLNVLPDTELNRQMQLAAAAAEAEAEAALPDGSGVAHVMAQRQDRDLPGAQP
jgi:hypothetical protein